MAYLTGKGNTITWDHGHRNYSEYGSFGIFGYVASGTVKNLAVNGYLTKIISDNFGDIVGYLQNGIVQDCKSSTQSSNSGGNRRGGIVRTHDTVQR